ncbi:MAG: A/G-specific adenine glycosylase [Chloroflexi bacterium]|jgi:A/G-specific adenine glycosylase|nr:MAG: A/G-specific adenine glycosylase [Chloroflexota bacterium]
MTPKGNMSALYFHSAVAEWYGRNARDLPWRSEPYVSDPYAILVSEVMLQQTQVDRVVPKFNEFMAAFPTLAKLAAAQLGDVIRLWSGLGYNRRAVRLHLLAATVLELMGGELPSDVERLRALPGVGPYTAAAVACFAFGAAVPVAETNIYRVLSRVTWGVDGPSRKDLDATVAAFLPDKASPFSASAWHQALMDLGATICTARSPRCGLCPLRDVCRTAPLLRQSGERDLAKASVPYAPKQSMFAGSARFYRGRIVEVLRGLSGGQAMSLAELGFALFDAFDVQRDTERMNALVDGLARDNLVVREDEWVQLP